MAFFTPGKRLFSRLALMASAFPCPTSISEMICTSSG